MITPSKKKIRGFEGITHSIFLEKIGTVENWLKNAFFHKRIKKCRQVRSKPRKSKVSPDIEPAKITRDTKGVIILENAC